MENKETKYHTILIEDLLKRLCTNIESALLESYRERSIGELIEKHGIDKILFKIAALNTDPIYQCTDCCDH